jgi:hypothetical protein
MTILYTTAAVRPYLDLERSLLCTKFSVHAYCILNLVHVPVPGTRVRPYGCTVAMGKTITDFGTVSFR